MIGILDFSPAPSLKHIFLHSARPGQTIYGLHWMGEIFRWCPMNNFHFHCFNHSIGWLITVFFPNTFPNLAPDLNWIQSKIGLIDFGIFTGWMLMNSIKLNSFRFQCGNFVFGFLIPITFKQQTKPFMKKDCIEKANVCFHW